MSRFTRLTLADLESSLIYCPETGQLTRHNGDVAGTTNPSDGYRYVSVCGKQVTAARVCWCLYHKVEPVACPPIIDHRNGVRTDNRLLNLRASDKNRNNHNQALKRNNTTGLKNISRRPNGRWRVSVVAHGMVFDRNFVCLGQAITTRNERMRNMHKDHVCFGEREEVDSVKI